MLEEKVKEVSALLKSISHPLRLQILCILRDGELCVNDLQRAVETTPANMSQHLAILRNQGIVTSRRDANQIYNQIGDPKILELMSTLQHLYC